MELNTRVLAGAALVLLVVAAGLIFLSDSPTQEKQAGLEERYSSVQSYEGTMVIKNRIVGDARRKWVQRVFENGTVENVTDPVQGEVLKVRNVTRPVRGPNGSRVRQTFRIRTVRVPNVVIRNRTVKADVAFRRGSPDVYRYDFVEGFLPPDDVRVAVVRGDEATLYYNSERNESTNASLVGIETLGLRYADFIPNLRQKYQVTEVGTRTVMGTQTRLLNLTPTSNVSPRKSVDQVWVSQQTGLPVKILRRQSGTGQENAEVITTVAYRNMEFNTTLSDGFFTVSTDQLPSPDDEGQAGNQTDVNVSYKDYDTIESAQSAVGFDILVPSALPESYTLNKVTVKTFEGNKSARLKYANATSKMMILETVNLTPRGSDLGGKAKTVQVSGSQGTYLRLGGIGILRWNCGKYSIEVSGEFDQQKLIDIAESFSCNQ